MSRKSYILVVDDDEQDLGMTTGALKGIDDGPQVVTARDGAEALDCLFANDDGSLPEGIPVLILLDLNMPRVDGWEVLRRVKSDISLRALPIVIFSSSAGQDDVSKCYDLGANAYVTKPAPFDEFISTVRDIMVFWTKRNIAPSVARPFGSTASNATA